MSTETHDLKPETAAASFRLARFVAVLALDPGRLQDFIAEPETEMAAAGLTETEKKLLRHRGFENLCNYLWAAGAKPVSEDQPGGSGAGTGSGSG